MRKASSTLFPLPLLISLPPSARFKNSRFDNELDLEAFTERFDTGLRVTFSDSNKPYFVKFGSPRDHDARCGIKGGKFALSG